MRTNAKFKYTNFLKRDRYQAKRNAVTTCLKGKIFYEYFILLTSTAKPYVIRLNKDASRAKP